MQTILLQIIPSHRLVISLVHLPLLLAWELVCFYFFSITLFKFYKNIEADICEILRF